MFRVLLIHSYSRNIVKSNESESSSGAAEMASHTGRGRSTYQENTSMAGSALGLDSRLRGNDVVTPDDHNLVL